MFFSRLRWFMEYGRMELRKEMINHVEMQQRARSSGPQRESPHTPHPQPPWTSETHNSLSEQVCNYLEKAKTKICFTEMEFEPDKGECSLPTGSLSADFIWHSEPLEPVCRWVGRPSVWHLWLGVKQTQQLRVSACQCDHREPLGEPDKAGSAPQFNFPSVTLGSPFKTLTALWGLYFKNKSSKVTTNSLCQC